MNHELNWCGRFKSPINESIPLVECSQKNSKCTGCGMFLVRPTSIKCECFSCNRFVSWPYRVLRDKKPWHDPVDTYKILWKKQCELDPTNIGCNGECLNTLDLCSQSIKVFKCPKRLPMPWKYQYESL